MLYSVPLVRPVTVNAGSSLPVEIASPSSILYSKRVMSDPFALGISKVISSSVSPGVATKASGAFGGNWVIRVTNATGSRRLPAVGS